MKHPLRSADWKSATFHWKSATFVMSNRDIDCILIHNFFIQLLIQLCLNL